MASHSQQSSQITEGDELPQEETPSQTYDDKLADKYKDLSSQNELAKQVFVALALAGASYGKEVIGAYNLLKKELDPEKLIKDPVYKRRVERSVELVKRHEGKRLKEGKSKYTATIQRTENGLKWTRFAHEKVEYVKKSLSFQYGVDMRRIYGFGDEEMKTIYQGALQRVKERPGLSMQEAMRIETRVSFLQKKSEIEVNKDEKYNNPVKRLLRRKERKEEVEKRIETHEEDFIKSTSNIYELEKKFSDKRIEEGTRFVSSSLGVEYKPKTAEPPASTTVPVPQTQPPPTPEAAPAQATAPTPSPTPFSPPSVPQQAPPLQQTLTSLTRPAPPPPPPPSSPPTTPPSPISRLSENITSLRQRAAGRMQTGLSRIASPVQSLFSKPRVNLGNLFGGLGNKLGGLFSKGKSLLAKGSGLALSAGKKLITHGLNAAVPGLGFAAEKINDVIKNLTGIDVMGTGVKLVVATILLVAVGIPMIFILLISGKGNMFSHVTSKNPVRMKASLPENKIYTWQEFEKKFLTLDEKGSSVSWKQFEKENLVLQEKYLSKNQE